MSIALPDEMRKRMFHRTKVTRSPSDSKVSGWSAWESTVLKRIRMSAGPSPG